MNNIWKNFYLNIELINSDAKMPTRAKQGDAGCDIYTPIDIHIKPWSDTVIPIGWRYEMPNGFMLKVTEKSGIATNKQLHCGACICDSQYRGQVHVHLFNNSNKDIFFNKGNKIAQFIIIPIWDGQPIQVNQIDLNTDRGAGKFGSTGDK